MHLSIHPSTISPSISSPIHLLHFPTHQSMLLSNFPPFISSHLHLPMLLSIYQSSQRACNSFILNAKFLFLVLRPLSLSRLMSAHPFCDRYISWLTCSPPPATGSRVMNTIYLQLKHSEYSLHNTSLHCDI